MLCAFILSAALATGAPLESGIRAVAALPGEPNIVSAAGLTKAETPILSLENTGAFDPASTRRRLVIVGGLDGEERSARAVVDLVRWFKQRAPGHVRRRWTVSAVPLAAFDAADAASFERWVTFQAPDLLVEVRNDGKRATLASIESALVGAEDALAKVPQLIASAPAARSPLRETILKRVTRQPLEIATLLAKRYPETPSISYIPSVAWSGTLRLAAITGDRSLAEKVRAQTASRVRGEQPLFANRILLTSVAGTMVFADLGGDALPRALEGAKLAASVKDNGIAEYGQGWTDDMFMASAILARVGRMPEHRPYLDQLGRFIVDYAARLQRPDGIFVHATDGPYAWGRGNGFAALGLMETLSALPDRHPARASVLAIYKRHMDAVKAHQSPDGMWREVLDEPGAYREETATAMLMTAMLRGIRYGWIDRSFLPVVERAWRGLAAHVKEDGTLIDVCTGTGAGPTRRYYLDRAAITGADDRGGAMALLASMEMKEFGDAGVRRPSSRPRGANSSAAPSVR